MHIQTIRTIAKTHGLKVGGLSKATMIRAIQRAEGNFDCFGSAVDGYCDQSQCAWREGCLDGGKKRKH